MSKSQLGGIVHVLEVKRSRLSGQLMKDRELVTRLVAAHPGLTDAELAQALRWSLRQAQAVLRDQQRRRVLQQNDGKWTLRGRRS